VHSPVQVQPCPRAPHAVSVVCELHAFGATPQTPFHWQLSAVSEVQLPKSVKAPHAAEASAEGAQPLCQAHVGAGHAPASS
jgi:hypothetical protein